MITLHLTRGKDPEGIYIRLPAPQEKIEEAMTRLDAISEDTATTRILNVSSSVKNLGDYIQDTDLSYPDGLQKVAALAEKLQALDLESCLKFEGMLDANMVQGVDDVMKLADCLDEYPDPQYPQKSCCISPCSVSYCGQSEAPALHA